MKIVQVSAVRAEGNGETYQAASRCACRWGNKDGKHLDGAMSATDNVFVGWTHTYLGGQQSEEEEKEERADKLGGYASGRSVQIMS